MPNKTAYERLPMHELLQRAKGQGLWPIPMDLEHLPTEQVLVQLRERTGHKIAYIRAVFEAGKRLDPSNWPSLVTEAGAKRVKADLTKVGAGKFKSRPNPIKRAGLAKSKEARQSVIKAANEVIVLNPKPGVLVGVKAHELYKDKSVPIKTNGPQIDRTAKQFAPVLTNARMRKASKRTTQFSTGFVPPSRKDNTRAIPKKQEGTYKRFSKT